MPDKLYISFFPAFPAIDPTCTKELLDICTGYVAQGGQEVCLHISSWGGNIISGFTIYNELRALPIKLTTHNVGSVNSIANIVFLAGETRYAAPTSTFLFHGTSQYYKEIDIRRPILAEHLAALNADEARMRKVFVERTKLTMDEIKSLMDSGETKGPDFALDKGVIHEIREPFIPAGSTIIRIPIKLPN